MGMGVFKFFNKVVFCQHENLTKENPFDEFTCTSRSYQDQKKYDARPHCKVYNRRTTHNVKYTRMHFARMVL